MMKIRSDFVTNSSSNSTTEIVIDNLVLLEILAKYEQLGAFGDEAPFLIGSGNVCENWWSESHIKSITPAINGIFEDDFSGSPHSLDKVLEKIIEILDQINNFSEEFDEQLFGELTKELLQRKDEIESAFVEVSWCSRINYYSGIYQYWQFRYDQINGEFYHNEDPYENEEHDFL